MTHLKRKQKKGKLNFLKNKGFYFVKYTVKRMKKNMLHTWKKEFQISCLIKDICFVYVRSLKLNNSIKSGQRPEANIDS